MDTFDERSDVPIIAFFGTKGGVGKTTITSRFAEFVSYSVNSPNILMIDFDVDHRGLTVLCSRGRGFSCKTIHEYVKDGITSLDSAIDVTEEKRLTSGGKLYLIPSAHADSKLTFRVTADLNYNDLVNTIIELIKEAVSRYDIGCVVIDCGPVINPYTAAAAHIADHAFIIGQNEPISYEALSNYSHKIREFFDEFNSSKMAVILNKVRGSVKEGHGIFAVIPFTLEVVDISEGLDNVDTIRVVLFESYIQAIVVKIFHKIYSGPHCQDHFLVDLRYSPLRGYLVC
ncbi:AAA family ATPase [Candidatus Magnetomonas plexicatena]|uniref:AAA family ATPase n=1 Tax=Candidatus Magnetomonas plexicatena TaxID=2552947 RepID=UPI001C7606DC|nr:ParA family protein [Nitrospirales bacterium LBB_01]